MSGSDGSEWGCYFWCRHLGRDQRGLLRGETTGREMRWVRIVTHLDWFAGLLLVRKRKFNRDERVAIVGSADVDALT